MEDGRFDELAKKLAQPISRGQAIKAVAAAALGGMFARFGSGEVFAQGNSDCASFCHATFSGSDAGHCTADAARGRGLCHTPCGSGGSGGTLCGGPGYSSTTCCPNGQSTCIGGTCCSNASVCSDAGGASVCGCPSGSMCCGTPGVCTALGTTSNCTVCNDACRSGETCTSTGCMCGTGSACMSGQICDNGACYSACSAGPDNSLQPTCANGACVCVTDTGGNPVCVQPRAACPEGTEGYCMQNSDCGTGNVCISNPYCGNQGVCNAACGSCPTGLTLCNGLCVDENNDVNNCGTCGNQCAVGATCSNGVCVCPGTSNQCAGSGNVCVNGACQQSCGTGQTCANYTPTNGQYCVSNAEGGTTIGLCTPGGVPPGQTCTTAACTSSADCATFNTGTQQYFCQTYTSCNGTCTGNQSVCVPFC